MTQKDFPYNIGDIFYDNHEKSKFILVDFKEYNLKEGTCYHSDNNTNYFRRILNYGNIYTSAYDTFIEYVKDGTFNPIKIKNELKKQSKTINYKFLTDK